MSSATHRMEFGPPPTDGLSRSLVLAVLAHLVLVGALTLGVQWRRTAPTVEVQAELWSAIPQAAAPRLVEPPPAPPPRPPVPTTVARPIPAPPSPDADIALQREKQRLEKEKQVAAQQREQERLAALEKKREQELREKEQKQKLAAQKKQEQERQAALDKQRAQEQREKEKLAAETKREREREQELLQAQKVKEDEVRLEAQRQVNLQRIAGLAGASGAPGAAGTALKASGPSSSYGGRVSAIVKPNIVFIDNPQDNPTALVEVRAAPDGTIISRKLVKSSGNKAWDDAVLKAIDKTVLLPRDIDGTVPPLLEINFRRRD